jgi:prophage tail gpP-like protein
VLQEEKLYNPEDSVVVYQHPESGVQITVNDNDTLQSGIMTLRTAATGGYTISFVVMAKIDQAWTGSTYEEDEDRRPHRKRKRNESEKKGKKAKKKRAALVS